MTLRPHAGLPLRVPGTPGRAGRRADRRRAAL